MNGKLLSKRMDNFFNLYCTGSDLDPRADFGAKLRHGTLNVFVSTQPCFIRFRILKMSSVCAGTAHRGQQTPPEHIWEVVSTHGEIERMLKGI